jgi:hypothetical protein
MAFLEYMLLALLGSASATPAGTPTRTFTADALTQPSGGTEGLIGQDTPPKKSSRHREARRHHRRGAPIAAYQTGGAGHHSLEARRQHKGHRHGKELSGKRAGPLPVPPKTEKPH